MLAGPPASIGPAAVPLLAAAQVGGGAPLHLEIGLAEHALDQHVFGRDRHVGLEVEQEMPVVALVGGERPRGAGDGGVEAGRRRAFHGETAATADVPEREIHERTHRWLENTQKEGRANSRASAEGRLKAPRAFRRWKLVADPVRP